MLRILTDVDNVIETITAALIRAAWITAEVYGHPVWSSPAILRILMHLLEWTDVPLVTIYSCPIPPVNVPTNKHNKQMKNSWKCWLQYLHIALVINSADSVPGSTLKTRSPCSASPIYYDGSITPPTRERLNDWANPFWRAVSHNNWTATSAATVMAGRWREEQKETKINNHLRLLQ